MIKEINNFADSIDFSKLNGLVPAAVQDYYSKEVLMLAFMNKEALKKTLETGYAHYYSRSRRQLWKKGETSGHTQEVKEIFYDCDSDSILLKIIQIGDACHTGHKTCFYSKLDNNLIKFNNSRDKNIKNEDIKDIEDTIDTKNIKDSEFNKEKFYSLKLIFDLIKSRKISDTEKSYTAKLINAGLEKIGKKLQEESLELIIAGFNKEKHDIIYEAADLLFFYMVLLVYLDIDINDIIIELKKREGISGIDEKNSRKI
ncbi:MAG: bifunctional phosphoribosyl-AMP cyclohydrolase/phosphoribosyl-ATP diphosphatase HisIE [bacterium]